MSAGKPILRILVGLPGSGKSTYTKSLPGAWINVNYDQMRWYAPDGSPVDYKFSRENEDAIKATGEKIAVSGLIQRFNVLIDNTNLTPSVQDHWRRPAAENGAKFEIVNFDTPLDECIARNKLRVGWARIPRAVIERMALATGRVPWPDNRRAVIVDIDGTLADGSHREKYVSGKCLNPECHNGTAFTYFGSHCGRDMPCLKCAGTGKVKKDWDKYFSLLHLDTPVKAVVEWTKSLKDQGYYVIIVSGRSGDADIARGTEDWLEKHGVPYDRLYMRKTQDRRDDTIIKKEILDAIRPHIEIAFAIDDRPRVIRMWRDNGVKVYDVGDGIEF